MTCMDITIPLHPQQYMKQVAESYQGDSSQPMPIDERNLLSVAYKNVVGARRSAWRVANASCQSEKASDVDKEVAKQYKKTIEVELKKVCNEVLVSERESATQSAPKSL